MSDRMAPGTRFASYTVEGLIAGGGMGQVYAARHEVYGTPVALKVLHEALHADPDWRARFNEEGLVGTRLKHPHVLSARELVEHGGRIALVLDLVSGGQTLEKVLNREHPVGLPLLPAMRVFLAIVQGIEYLHGKGIVHGDLKPENVMLQGDFRAPETWVPKVTDFGTVGLVAHPVVIDGRVAVVATPRYASPEHLLGVDHIEPRSDVYALGLILHYLLTGKHASSARTVREALDVVTAPINMSNLVDQPEPLLELFRRATDPVADARYASCRELALAVRSVLDAVGSPLELEDLQADLATEVDEQRRAAAEPPTGEAPPREEPVLEPDEPTDDTAPRPETPPPSAPVSEASPPPGQDFDTDERTEPKAATPAPAPRAGATTPPPVARATPAPTDRRSTTTPPPVAPAGTTDQYPPFTGVDEAPRVPKALPPAPEFASARAEGSWVPVIVGGLLVVAILAAVLFSAL